MNSPLWSEWWVWMCAALLLGILEVLVPAFVFLGFALGAGMMAVLLAFDFVALGMAWSVLLFAVMSLIAYVILRRIFGMKRGQVKIWDRDINDN